MAVIKVADEVWLAAALLHRRYPDRGDFSVSEIVAQAEAANATGAGSLRPGVQIHAYLHCVANRRPNPARLRMLTETSRGRRRLYRPGDDCHPGRLSAASFPEREALPPAYRDLLDWYHDDYLTQGAYSADEREMYLREAVHAWPVAADPILALAGCGREIWADEDADAYVRRLREGWE